MRTDTFNKPPQSDISSTCKIFKLSSGTNFCIILLGSFCFHMRIHLFNYQHFSLIFPLTDTLCSDSGSQTFP